MGQQNSLLTATRVVYEGDRVLIYGHQKWEDYHIIAPKDCKVAVNDKVKYEPFGWNFGWFISIEKL